MIELIEFVAATLGILVGVWLLLAIIDWLDWFTSRMTPEQAQRRTRQWLAQQPLPESARAILGLPVPRSDTDRGPTST